MQGLGGVVMTITKRRKWRWLVPAGVMGVLLTAAAAWLGSVPRDVRGFSLHEVYLLKQGENRSGDQLVVGYKIELEPASTIDGEVTLIGNRVIVNADVNGDLVVVAKRLQLGDSAHVNGDLVACVNDLERSPEAQVSGEVRKECTEGGQASVSSLFESGLGALRENSLIGWGSAFGGALFWGAMAALSVVLVPQPLSRISLAARQAPFAAGGVGCLTLSVAVGLTAFYFISLFLVLPIVLFPFVLMGWLVIGLFSLLGWVALAEPFGRMVFRRLQMEEPPPMIAAGLGAVTLSLLLRVWAVFWVTSWIALLAWVVLGSIGLGAVVLTQVGTERYPQVQPHRHRTVFHPSNE